MHMDLGLWGKRALVTAASRGLGRASARALAAEGACVAVAGRNIEPLQDLSDDLRRLGAADALAVRMDLSVAETVASGVAATAEAFGGLDILVGNTGGPPSGRFLSIARSTWESSLNAILLSLVDLSHAAIPLMQEAGGGRIIFITTVGVKVVQPNMVLSDSIRLAVVGLAKSLSLEFAKDGILVNCLCPGPIATDRMEDLIVESMQREGIGRAAAEAIWLDEVPLRKFGSPAHFGAIVAMLASDQASFISGATLTVDGGKSRAY
jgi:3-oxoacyl-[acyl-carrier protein] reductase